MGVFLLILRILLLIGVVAGIIMVCISGIVAEAKKFQKKETTDYYKVRFKVIGFLVSACSIAVLMILSLF